MRTRADVLQVADPLRALVVASALGRQLEHCFEFADRESRFAFEEPDVAVHAHRGTRLRVR